MRLTETLNKINPVVNLRQIYYRVKHAEDLPKDLFILLLIGLTAVGAFFLGRISALEEARKSDLKVIRTSTLLEDGNRGDGGAPVSQAAAGMYVGSRSGTTYHLPWCSGASRIKEDNKVWFDSKEEAEQSGYKAAANCRGI